MSSWARCSCGNVIGVGAFPNPKAYRVIAEEDFDRVTDPVDRQALSRLFVGGFELVRCPVCERVLIREKGAQVFESYVREDGQS